MLSAVLDKPGSGQSVEVPVQEIAAAVISWTHEVDITSSCLSNIGNVSLRYGTLGGKPVVKLVCEPPVRPAHCLFPPVPTTQWLVDPDFRKLADTLGLYTPALVKLILKNKEPPRPAV